MNPLGVTILLGLLLQTWGGFGPPSNPRDALKIAYGNPCNCKGGTLSSGQFTGSYTQSVDCGNKMAYLKRLSGLTGVSQSWICREQQIILYHPLVLPRPKEVSLDPQTQDLLRVTHKALNLSNPNLAEDCWLCLAQGTQRPLALPANLTVIRYCWL